MTLSDLALTGLIVASAFIAMGYILYVFSSIRIHGEQIKRLERQVFGEKSEPPWREE